MIVQMCGLYWVRKDYNIIMSTSVNCSRDCHAGNFADDLTAWNTELLDLNEMPLTSEKSDVVLQRLGTLQYDGRNWGEPNTDFDFTCRKRVLVFNVRVRGGVVSEVEITRQQTALNRSDR